MTAELFDFDKSFGKTVAGIDEAGRGPLAGPVVCACCVMPLDEIVEGINDSKKVSERLRDKLFDIIVKKALYYGIGIIEHTVIDEINILNATKKGMEQAYRNMNFRPELVLIDAVKIPLDVPVQSIVKGDMKSYSIAAASILAKVTRDRIMLGYDLQYPLYGFKANKGYPTKSHIEALKAYGECPLHRQSFLKNFKEQSDAGK